MFGWLFKPRCPLDDTAKKWIDQRWRWLTDTFGSDVMVDSPTILPTPDFFPDEYDPKDDDTVTILAHRVCDYMNLSKDLIDLTFFSNAGNPEFVNSEGHALGSAAGLFQDGARYEIRIERSQFADPMHLVGTLAHETAHARLRGDAGLASEPFDEELLTDLTVCFHGLGIFLANAPRHWHSDATTWPGTTLYKPEYMTTPMHGYALALRCWLREEPLPPWRKHLKPAPRSEFQQALKFLQSQSS